MSRSDERDDQLRNQLLAGLVPAVVHELNNSLAVLRGSLEVIAQETGDVGGQQAVAESIKAATLLTRLSLFSKSDEEPIRELDLCQVVRDVEPLLAAFAKSQALGVELQVPQRVALVDANEATLWRSLSALVLRLAQAARGAPGRPRIRLALRPHGQGLAIRLLSNVPVEVETEALEALGTFATAVLASVSGAHATGASVHRSRNALGVEVRLPGSLAGGDAGVRATSTGARVLLLGLGDDLEDVVEELLLESGYAVTRSRGAEQGLTLLDRVPASVALVDARLLTESQAFLSRLVGDRETTETRAILLGPERNVAGLPSIPHPCPPDVLLAALQAALA